MPEPIVNGVQGKPEDLAEFGRTHKDVAVEWTLHEDDPSCVIMVRLPYIGEIKQQKGLCPHGYAQGGI
jgi:hypothetical protein